MKNAAFSHRDKKRARRCRALFVRCARPALQLLGALVLGLVVALGADDVEAAVELHVDLAAVVAGDLDLVVALLVAGLGLRDLATAGRLERSCARSVQGTAGDRSVGSLGGVFAASGRDGDAGAACCER